MLRWIGPPMAALSIAAAANAVSLSVNSDKLTYLVGETVTLTVTGDLGLDATGYPIRAYSAFGRLDYSGALVDNGTRSQTALVGEIGTWVKGSLDQGDNGVTAFSYAFNQVAGLTADTATNLPAAFATVTLIAQEVGFVGVNWHTTLGLGEELLFFGITNAPGTYFSIIPEPATGALLGLGLVALAVGPRIRARRPLDAR